MFGRKQKTFSVPIKKELENGKTATCKIMFIDNFRFIPSSLSSLADNLLKDFITVKAQLVLNK